MVFPLIQQLVLSAFPHGGQGHARRNAWAGMVADAAVTRVRREAEALVQAQSVGARRAL